MEPQYKTPGGSVTDILVDLNRPGEWDSKFFGRVGKYLIADFFKVGHGGGTFAAWIEQQKGEYRVEIMADRTVKVLALPIVASVDKSLEGVYESIKHLPEWMQGRLATLRMVPVNQKPMPHYPGVGMRVSEKVYWIEQGGEDA